MSVAAAAALILSGLTATAATAATSTVTPTEAVEASAVDSGIVRAAPVVGFDPGTIIDDALFFDGGAMSAAEIQSFLDQKNRCTNGRCLNTSTASISSRAAVVSHRTGNLVCNAVEGGTMRTSELIYRMQVACGISAKVILVTLEKEQSLVTGRTPSERNFTYAMGANCPDTAPCDPNHSGIGPQILAGVTSLKNYSAGRFSRQPGVHWIGYSPNANCGGTNVNVTNFATAALYNYTPYQPNASALAAGYGLGDGCGSYGNRNFYNFYKDWFGAPTRAGWTFGNLEMIEPLAGGFRVVGWAADPDTTSAIEVHIYVGGVGYPVIADGTRPDVGAAHPSVGANHGFDARVPANPGQSVSLCVYAVNAVGKGSNTTLGCRDVTPATGSPQGTLDEVASAEGGVTVRGWAIDPDTLSAIQVHAYINGRSYRLTADSSRPDLSRHLLGHGTAHGYSGFIPAAAGSYEVCTYGINVASGANVQLGCKTATAGPLVEKARVPIGALDSVTVAGTTITASGWAIDPDTAQPVSVHLYVSGAGSAHMANGTRSDVGNAYPAYGSGHGFVVSKDVAPGSVDVCAYAINTVAGANPLIGCKRVEVKSPPKSTPPVGSLDEIATSAGQVSVRGWSFDPDSMASGEVHVYVSGVGYSLRADAARPDVAAAFGSGRESTGFAGTFSVSPGSHRVCVYGINDAAGDNPLLACSTVVVP